MRAALDQNVKKQRLPSDLKGQWSGDIGNSKFILNDETELNIYHKQSKDWYKISGKKFKEKLIAEYGVDTVDYCAKEPNFSNFVHTFKYTDICKEMGKKLKIENEAENFLGDIYLDDFSSTRDGTEGTFSKATTIVAEYFVVDPTDIEDYMRKKDLTWHEVGDRHTIQAIPSEINQVFTHTGGIGIQKDVTALAEHINDIVDGNKIALKRIHQK